MKNHIIIALSILTLASCSGKDPIYWFTEEATAGGAGSNIPYQPDEHLLQLVFRRGRRSRRRLGQP